MPPGLLLQDPDVHTAIVGTTNIDHLEDNPAAEAGRLPEEMLAEIEHRFGPAVAASDSLVEDHVDRADHGEQRCPQGEPDIGQ